MAPPVVRNRIRDDDSRIVERAVILALACWLGGLIMVTLAATGSFKAVDTTIEKPPAVVIKSLARLGPDVTRDLLRYQSSEVNRHLFELWGWIQLGLTGAILAGLLFMTNVGKRVLGMALAMTAMAALMAGVIIPGMIRIGRESQARPDGLAAGASQTFKTLHQAFGAFEGVAAVLAMLTIVSLIRRGARARG
jgi:hypothetical protein